MCFAGMKVILLEDVNGLGKAGAVKEVKNGYGLNYLLPEGLADFATPQLIKQAEAFITKRAKEAESMVAVQKETAGAVSGRKVVIRAKTENGKLFGSIGREEVAEALKAAGVSVDAEVLSIRKPFKETGVFPVEADFGHGVKAAFEVSIEAE